MAVLKPQYLYLMGERRDGPIKVGVARCPHDRRRELQTGHAARLQLFWVYPCPHGAVLEGVIHRILAPRRMAGEWFDVPIETAMGALWIAVESHGPGKETEELREWWRRQIGLTFGPVTGHTDELVRWFDRGMVDWMCW